MDLSEHAVDEEQDRYENVLARSNNDGTDSSKITKMGTIWSHRNTTFLSQPHSSKSINRMVWRTSYQNFPVWNNMA